LIGQFLPPTCVILAEILWVWQLVETRGSHILPLLPFGSDGVQRAHAAALPVTVLRIYQKAFAGTRIIFKD